MWVSVLLSFILHSLSLLLSFSLIRKLKQKMYQKIKILEHLEGSHSYCSSCLLSRISYRCVLLTLFNAVRRENVLMKKKCMACLREHIDCREQTAWSQLSAVIDCNRFQVDCCSCYTLLLYALKDNNNTTGVLSIFVFLWQNFAHFAHLLGFICIIIFFSVLYYHFFFNSTITVILSFFLFF